MIKFSIGIPAYKASFLKKCIDSVLSQTYSNFELIIVNDNSPEDIDSIINTYADKRIQYYKNEKNFGAEHVVDNWNKCLSFAEGEYFVLMGDDDEMDRNYLSQFHDSIKKYPEVDIFHCRSYIIDQNSERIYVNSPLPEFESAYEFIWCKINSYRNQYISDFVYKRVPLVNSGGFYKLPLAWASDDISAYRAAGAKGIVHINKPIFNYRKSTLTISSSVSSELKIKSIIQASNWIEKFLDNSVPSTESDALLKELLRKQIPKYIETSKVMLISKEIYYKPMSAILFWISNKKTYNVKLLNIALAILKSIKMYNN